MLRNFPMREGTSRRARMRLTAVTALATSLGLSVADAMAQAGAGGRGRNRSRGAREPLDARPWVRAPGQTASGRDSPSAGPPQAQFPPTAAGAGATSVCSSSSGWWRRCRAPARAASAAQDRSDMRADGAPAPDRAAAARPRRLLGPVPVLEHAAAHAALHRSSPTRPTAPASGSPTSRPSAARSWAPATAPTRTTSSASSPATTAARNTSRRRAAATRNPFSPLWGEEEREPAQRPNQFGNLPFATYRTLCVRLCDGYYFPVSFSTLPNHFQRDSEHLPVAVRGAGRALLSPEPRRCGGADGLGRQPAALYRA